MRDRLTRPKFALIVLTLSISLLPAHARVLNDACLAERLADENALADYPRVWRDYAFDFKKTTTDVIERNRSAILSGLKRKDPFLLFLEQELGFGFQKRGDPVPNGIEVLKRINALIDECVAGGLLKESEVLRPARAFKTRAGKIVMVPLGAEPPAGAIPFLNLLPPSDFIAALKKGLYPFGETPSGILFDSPHTPALHDAAHFERFIRHADYTASLRRSVSKLNSKHLENRFLKDRLFFANETLIEIRPRALNEMSKTLQLPGPQKKQGPVLTVNQVYAHLKTLSAKEINTLKIKIIEKFPNWIDFVSGGDNDFFTRLDYHRHSYNGHYKGQTPYSLYDALLYPEKYGLKTSDDITMQLARIQTALMGLSEIPASSWVSEALKPKMDRNSKLAIFICRSGVWKPVDRIFQAHCSN